MLNCFCAEVQARSPSGALIITISSEPLELQSGHMKRNTCILLSAVAGSLFVIMGSSARGKRPDSHKRRNRKRAALYLQTLIDAENDHDIAAVRGLYLEFSVGVVRSEDQDAGGR